MAANTATRSAAADRAPAALGIIEDEHRTLAAVLHGLRFLVDEIRNGRMKPDFELFRAMVYYVDAYPERLHHPKEEDFLFRCLRARTSEADTLLDELKSDHAAGEGAIRNLEKKLLAYEFGNRFDAFAAAADAYVAAYFVHMGKEEKQVLPLALKWLTAEDWHEVGAAFAANRDPASDPDEPSFRALFSRIVNLAPPPIGVGPLFPPRR
jgi:hemerythrin-like domain-containing protein